MNVKNLNQYKENCYSALSRDLTEFEKNFLLISGAILAFSITFIKDIIKINESEFLFLLFIGWFLIITSIGIMMHTFLKSADTSNMLSKIVDEFIEENNLYDEIRQLSDEESKTIKIKINSILHPCKERLKSYRKWVVNFFLFGVLSFALFVSLNLLEEKKGSANKINSNTLHNVFFNDTVILKNLIQ